MSNLIISEINSYVDSLPKNIPDTRFPFVKSSLGSTGVTFLPKDFNFKWVVKWQNPALTETEFACTQLFKKSFPELSVPEAIYPVPDDLLKKFRSLFSTKSISDQYVPMLLEFKRGNNLNKLFENGLIFKLPTEELESLFETFGMIAGCDTLIANYDRFMPLNYRGILDSNHSANGGNVMVELNVPANMMEETSSVKSVYVIDISPHSLHFFDPKERKVEEVDLADVDGFGGMFGEEEEFSTTKEERTSIGDDLRKQRFDDFKHFMELTPDKIPTLASQVAVGIKNEWFEKYPKQIEEVNQFISKPAIQSGLEKGLLRAQRTINELDIDSVLEELNNNSSFVTESPKIVFQFVQKNIELQKLKLTVSSEAK